MGKTARRLRTARLRVLGPPNINKKSITFRAAFRIPPFRDAGRGFKDELVLLSMLSLLSRFNYRSAVLVSRDEDFEAGVEDRFKKQNVTLFVVGSLAEASQLVSRGLDAVIMEREDQRAAAALLLANQHWEQISRSIQDSAKSDGIPDYLITDPKRDDLPTGSSIKRLVEVVPRKIDEVVVGFEGKTKGRTLMTIDVECDITLEVEESNLVGYALSRTITMEEKERPFSFPKPERKMVTVKRTLSIEASAKEGPDNTWSDLQLLLEDRVEYISLLKKIFRDLKQS
jgi:hypothetical protein